MNELYLSKIELQDFRSFGKLHVELPPRPGVLVIHGSNGLGKSSIFDGLEWALTNKVDHFREARQAPVSHYLRRWDADADSQTSVSLWFGEQVVRRRLPDGLDPVGIADITAFLQRADWEKSIGHLDRYLLLTHFLGQSTISRMTHRDAKERWEFLQEPAQSDRAIEIIRVLHGHGSSTQARTFERKAQELAVEATSVEKLLASEEQYWSDAQLIGAVDDRAAQTESARMRSTLLKVLERLGNSKGSEVYEGRESLEGPADLYEFVQQSYSLREQQLSRARALVVERTQAQLEVERLSGALAELQTQSGTIASKLTNTEAQVAEGEAVLRRVLQVHNETRANIEAFDSFERAHTSLSQNLAALLSARSLREELTVQLEIAAGTARKSERRRALADRLTKKRTVANETSVRLANQLETVDRALKLSAGLREAISKHDVLVEENQDLQKRSSDALAVLEGTSQKVSGLELELAEAKRSIDALSAAVAAVSAHLPEDACECPVCSTSFSSKEELRGLINGAAGRLAPAILALENELEAAIGQRKMAQERYSALQFQQEQVRVSARRVEELSEGLQAILVGIEDQDAADLLAAKKRLESAISHWSFVSRRADHWLKHPVVGGVQGALDRWANAIEERNQISVSLADQQNAIQRSEERSQEARQVLNTFAKLIAIPADAPSTVVEAARREHLDRKNAGDTALVVARNRLDSLESERRAIKVSQAKVSAESVGLEDQIRDINVRLANLTLEWQRDLALKADAMDIDTIERLLRELVELSTPIRVVGEEIRKLREGRLAWLRQERHRTTLKDMRAILDAPPTADRASLRRSMAERQSNLLRRATAILQAKKIAQDANSEVSKRVEAFNEQFLAPLSKLMNRINRAILSQPEIGLDLKIGARKVEQRAIAASTAPDYVSKLDPQLVHSEGQMAALAVSMLTAASLTFPWSRWRALIMDDPLQHNDVVHAAAFADLMGNLVRARGYQILLTTHDLGQAEFLKRKFQAAEVPCTTVHLLGQGIRGVEYRIDRGGLAQEKSSIAD